MTETFLGAWVLFPLLMLAVCLGGGLLISRLGGSWLPPVLVLPVGFALLVAVSALGTSLTWLAPASGWIAVGLALIGFALAARAGSLRIPRPHGIPWAVIVGIAAFIPLAAPVVLTGTPTWTGYTRIVDLGFQLDFAKYLVEAGRALPLNNSSYHNVQLKLLPEGYPGGGQATLGAMATVARVDIPWAYQAYLAFAMAMGGLSIYSLLGRVTTNSLLRVIGAFVAIQANVMYAYALTSGIKELTTGVALVTVVAVIAERLPGEVRAPPWAMLPLAVPISAAVASFSFGVAPWIALLFLGLFAVSVVRKGARLRVLRDWIALTVLTLVVALPSLITSIKLFGIAKVAIGGVINLGLGNLAYPVPDWSAAGVWISPDYRYPITHVTATHVLDVIVIVLGVVGILYALKRRRWAVGLLGLGTPLALWYWVAHTGAWIQFKAFTITGVFALILAYVGLAGLSSSRRRLVKAVGWLGVAVVSGGVLYGNALAYHDSSLAPAARYLDLAAIGKRYAGQGPALYPAFDEYAEYFLRDELGTDTLNPANGQFTLRPGVPEPDGIGWDFDLNQIAPSFLQTFPLIIEPREPAASRAPSNYDLVQQTSYFNVWRRDRPSSDVVIHLPLSGSPTERGLGFCLGLQGWIRRAGPGATVAFVQTPVAAEASPVSGAHSPYWQTIDDFLKTVGAGYDTMTFTVPTGDVYTLWMRGSVGRPMHFTLDGHPLGTLAYQERYPLQWLQIGGTVRIAAGKHTLRVTRGNGSLHPGSGDGIDLISDQLGPVIVRREDANAGRVEVAPAADANRVCYAHVGYEWMEVLRPGGAPADALHVDD